MVFYGPLAQVAVGATSFFVLFSAIFSRTPVVINGVLVLAVLGALAVYSFFLSLTPFTLPYFLFEIVWQDTLNRKCLLVFWTLNVIASVLFAVIISLQARSSTIHRKFFHLTVSLIFISGVFLDRDFLWLCGWLLVCIFVILEVLRYYNVPPWGETLNHYLLVFKDSQDGDILFTPIYLLIGIFLPLFLAFSDEEPRLYHLAGVAAVGFGDSLAAIVGSTLGSHRWPGRSKTVEGSVAMFLGVGLFLLAARPFCAEPMPSCLYCLLVAALLSLLEAFVKNVDNVLLPLVGYLLL